MSGVGGDAQEVKSLLCKHGGLSLDLQRPGEKPGMTVHAYTLSTGGGGGGGGGAGEGKGRDRLAYKLTSQAVEPINAF